MPTYKYRVAPNSQGGFTTRAVLSEPVPESVLVAQIAAAAGVTAEQVTSVMSAAIAKILECSAGCAWSPGVFGGLRFRPTSGGSQPATDAFDNPDEINADVALSFTAERIRDWRATLTLESLGEVGKLSPIVDTIISQDNGQANHYAPGTMIELVGENLRFDKADATQGVFFRSGNNAEVRATVYGTITPGSLSVLVPASLSGPLTVRAAAFINGSVRSFTYMDPITS